MPSSRFDLFRVLLSQFNQIVVNVVIMIGVGIILPFRIMRVITSNLFRHSTANDQLTLSPAEKSEFILRQLSNFVLFLMGSKIIIELSNMQTALATSPAPTALMPPFSIINATDFVVGMVGPHVEIIPLFSNITFISFLARAAIMTPPRVFFGEFMRISPNLDKLNSTFFGAASYSQIEAEGSLNTVNLVLRTLRFSLWDNTTQTNLSQIPVTIKMNGSGEQALVQGDLTLFGTNAAPIPTNATYANETVNLNTEFSIDLASPPRFIDPDGDPVSFIVTLADGSALPPSVQINNNVLVGAFSQAGVLNFLVSGTDGYKTSTTALAFSVACKYIPPFVVNAIPARVFPVGQGFTLSIPLSTFAGLNLVYTALANGFPLPKGLDFNADLKLLTGFMSNDWLENITIIATDPYKASANTTFELSVFDTPPELSAPITTQVVRAKNPIIVSIPPSMFVDPDHLPSPLVYIIDSLADGTPLPSWIVYNANTKQLTAIPPAQALGQDFQIVVTASDGYKSTDANITLRVLPNQPPVVGQALSDMTAIAAQDLNYLIPPHSFRSPVGNPLTLSVQMQGDATQQLPGWVSFNNLVNVLYGRPADTDVGIVPIVVIADDGLGGIARQTINITVQQSALSLFFYWLDIAGKTTSGVLLAWSVYLARNQMLNHFREKKLICEHPFDGSLQHKIDSPYAAYVVAERVPHRHEVGLLSRCIAGAISLVSSYFYHQFSLAPLPHGSLPYWLNYHATQKIITLNPTLIEDGDESVIVTVRTLEGAVLVKFTVNPMDYKAFNVLTLPEQEQALALPKVLPEQKSPDSLNTSPNAPSVGYSSSTDSTPPELSIKLDQDSINLVKLDEKGTSKVVVEEPLAPSNVLNYGFFAKALNEARILTFEDETVECDFNIALQRGSL